MLRASLRQIGSALAVAALALTAGTAGAAPLGLEGGDIIEFIEFDGLQSNGDGASFDVSLGTIGGVTGDGRATSMTVTRGGGSVVLTDIGTFGSEVAFALDLDSYFGNFINPPTNTLLNTVTSFSGSSAVSPDFTVTIGGNTILEGNIQGLLIVAGLINTADTSPQTLALKGNIVLTGGNPALLNALGSTLFINGILTAAASVFNFTPELDVLGADGNIMNSNFTFAFSGILTPDNPQGFVPEPGTAFLMGSGLLGLLAVARRARNRGL